MFKPEEADEPREPWRCQHCNMLVYNLAGGYPAPGAPQPKYGGYVWKQLCTTCFDMLLPIREEFYWKALHENWKNAGRGNGAPLA